MNKVLIAALSLALVGCGHTGTTGPGVIPVQVPNLPAPLTQRAGQLPPITDNTLGGIHRDGVATDRAYNDVATRYNTLLDIYLCVQRTINEKANPDTCLQ